MAYAVFVEFNPETAYMAMLTGYFDGAGDRTADHALTVGGHVTPVRGWGRFRRDWRKVLDPLGISVFHMADFIAGDGEFAGWKGKSKEQAKVLRRLGRVILRHAHYGPATTVLLKDWKAVNDQYTLDECRITPYCIAAISVLNKSIEWIGTAHPDAHQVEFVYEQGDANQGDFDEFMKRVRKVAGNELDGMYPLFKPKSLDPLQAADFSAWEQRFISIQRLEGGTDPIRESLQMLMDRFGGGWGVIDQEKMRQWVEWLEVPVRNGYVNRNMLGKWRPAPLLRAAESRRAARRGATGR